jgi:hypothetical protein
MKTIYTFRGKKGENEPSEPKNGIWKTAQNQYGRVICLSNGNFTWRMKKYTIQGRKSENKPSEPKNKIWGPKSV